MTFTGKYSPAEKELAFEKILRNITDAAYEYDGEYPKKLIGEDLAHFVSRKRAYRVKQLEMEQVFFKDLEKVFHFETYPKKEKVMAKAYATAHSEGFAAIACEYRELTELILWVPGKSE